MIISRTPFRISFFGGGTDYPVWYRRHGGAVLATTIDKYCYLTCRYLPPFFEHRIRVVYSKIEDVQTVDQIAHPAVREILRFLKLERGVEIHHDGDLPARSGMGSSSSFTVGLLHALYALKGHMPTKHQLAMDGILLEQERLREMVGSQDQVSAAYGGFNHITFGPDGEIAVSPITLTAERTRELNGRLQLYFTGVSRTASEVAESYVENAAGREESLRALGIMVADAMNVLRDGNLDDFGRLLHDAWVLKRTLGSRVSNAHVESIYDAARAAGALGGKLLGAGGGGFLVLYVPPDRQKAVRDRLRGLLHVPFRFESSGSQIIFFDHETDYAAEDVSRDAPRRFRELRDVEDTA
jgi:D-glycero-alpha-D-manno-heptose-7-phosphate kinase